MEKKFQDLNMLENKKFKGYFLFNKEGNKILQKKLEIVDNV